MIEFVPKALRIQELSQMGFNTPVMQYYPAMMWAADSKDKLEKFLYTYAKQTFANIRTYRRAGDMEDWMSHHYLRQPLGDVAALVENLNSKGVHCMVDLENPTNGEYAGNIEINNTQDMGFTLEYVYKPLGNAMVRDVEDPLLRQTVFAEQDWWNTMKPINVKLRAVVKEAFYRFTKPYKSVILEWAYGFEPWGMRKHKIIFWEYRNYKGE